MIMIIVSKMEATLFFYSYFHSKEGGSWAKMKNTKKRGERTTGQKRGQFQVENQQIDK